MSKKYLTVEKDNKKFARVSRLSEKARICWSKLYKILQVSSSHGALLDVANITSKSK